MNIRFLPVVVFVAFLLSSGQSVAQYGPANLPANYSTALTINRIRAWSATAPETTPATLVSRPLKDVKLTTSYFDALGRPLQTVMKKGSLVTGGDSADLVTTVTYDEFGREKYQYLPFAANSAGGNTSINDGLFKLNPFPQQVQFYNSQLAGQPNETNIGPNNLNWAYSQVNYELTPLNRVEESYAAGSSWVGSNAEGEYRHSVRCGYWINTAADSVHLWTVTDVANDYGTYTATGLYAVGSLLKFVTSDEHGNQLIEFKNKDGKVVLKKVQLTATADNGQGKGHAGWICTYYVYDDMGNLRLVVQPKGVDLLMANSWNTTALSGYVITELSFRYEYDKRNRLIRKKLPSSNEIWNVYDARDRLVMTQNRNMRNGLHQWLYTKYDNYNRPVSTGFIIDNTNYNNLSYHVDAAYSSTDYPVLANYTIEELTNTFYDDYSWRSLYGNPLTDTYTTSYDSYLYAASGSAWPYPQANLQSGLTKGLVTGTRVKVLNSNTYLYTVNFYDNDGRIIQVQETNITGEKNHTTTQYSWAGQPLVVVNKQLKASPNAQNHTIITKMEYDYLGRLLTTKKALSGTLGTLAEQVIVSNLYNAQGRLKIKKFGPYGTPLETQTYDYNIRGWILGANRDYVKDTIASTTHFGYDLCYENRSFFIHGLQSAYNYDYYNGNIAGVSWKSGGDNMVRRYEYTYDAANRLTNAWFTQFTGSSFNRNAGIDFTTRGLTYDVSGNILTMSQMGWKAGSSALIDSLKYNYYYTSNKLLNVIDWTNDTATKLGDFHASAKRMSTLPAGKNNNAVDYRYDADGNLTADLNKDLGDTLTSGIVHNHLELPRYIIARKTDGSTKGTITYVYDALGNKLKKIVEDNTVSPTKIITTLYMQGAVYENDTLQFIAHEAGRMRFYKDYFLSGDSANLFAHDYFLKDYLGNVRMILTEQKDTIQYLASIETAYRTKEDNLFYNVGATAIAKSAIVEGYPADGNPVTTPNDYVAKLNGNDKKVGPATVLKVMSGDKLDIGVKYYYKNDGGTAGNSGDAIVSDLLSALAGGIVGNVGESKAPASLLNNATASPLLGAIGNFRTDKTTGQSGKPKAYLNWILLDEQFKYISAGSGAQVVGTYNAVLPLTTGTINVPRNGFLYVYVSNETPNWNVFFDNLSIKHITGEEKEETHYYPFGLAMNGISTKAAGPFNNKFKFLDREKQSEEFSDGSGMDVYDVTARTLDHQIGRFWQIDPLAEYMRRWGPYVYGFDNPVRFADNDGMEPGDSTNNSDFFLNRNGTKKVDDLVEVTVTPNKSSSWFHGLLDVVGIIDPFGIADGLNAVIYLAEGNYKEAALSAIGILPLGDIAKGLKWADEAEEVVEGIVKYEDEVVEVAEKNLTKHAKVPCGCFIAGTLVLTDSGYKRIEQIKPGDKVWTYNDTTHVLGVKKVVRVFEHVRDTVYKLNIGSELISTTSDHPFFVGGRWLEVKKLHVGDSVTTYQGNKIVISAIEIIVGRTTVHNFEVADYHSYYVSAQKVLVHNNGACNLELPPKKIVEQDGVTIEHYYKSGDHAPAHAHVKGGGGKTKIGQNGKPIEGSPELSAKQKSVVDQNKAKIRSTIKKIMKHHSQNSK